MRICLRVYLCPVYCLYDIIIPGTELHSRWMIRGRRRLLNLGGLFTPPRFELPRFAVRTASSQASDRLPLKRPSINAVKDFADRINVGTGTVGPVVVFVTGFMYIFPRVPFSCKSDSYDWVVPTLPSPRPPYSCPACIPLPITD